MTHEPKGNLIARLSDQKFWCGLFILNLILRVAGLYTPILDIDETQFVGFAHTLMDGGRPYLDTLDTKPLGIYLFYRLCLELFGRTNLVAVHAITTLITFAGAYFLYKTLKIFELKNQGRWAALLWIVFSTTFVPKYTATSINSILVIFLILSLYIMALNHKQNKLTLDFVCGLCMGVGFLFKYTAGIQTIVFFLWTLPFWVHNKGARFRFVFRNSVAAIGFGVPFILHGLYLNHLDVWPDFLQWSVFGSGQYIQKGSATISFWKSFILRFGTYVLSTLFVWIFALKALKQKFWQTPATLLLSLYFFLSLIPLCMSGRFYPHYFIHILPALCGLAALSIYKSPLILNPKKLKQVILALIIFPALLFWTMRLDYASFLKYFPDDQIYIQKTIGLKLKEISKPDDTILVWGFATAINFYAERKPAGRFLWTDLLSGRVPGPVYARVENETLIESGDTKVWQIFWHDMKIRKPTFIIDTAPADIHSYGKHPLKNYPELFNFIQTHYEIAETILDVVIYKLKP